MLSRFDLIFLMIDEPGSASELMVGRRMVEKRCTKPVSNDEAHRKLYSLLGIKMSPSNCDLSAASNSSFCSQMNSLSSSVVTRNETASSQQSDTAEFSLSQRFAESPSTQTEYAPSAESVDLKVLKPTLQEIFRKMARYGEPNLTYRRAFIRARDMIQFSGESSQQERTYFLGQLKKYSMSNEDSSFKPYSASTIKKYIQFVRKTVHPKLTPFASTLLQV